MSEPTAASAVTLRDYIRVYFRQKVILLVTFFLVLGLMYLLSLLETPIYESQVTLLITGEKKIEAAYYQETANSYSSGASTIALTQSEIALSNPVIERAVTALQLQKRPKDYEKAFASPLKGRLLDWLIEWREKRAAKKQPDETGLDPARLAFRKAVEGLKKNINVSPIKNTNLLTLSVRDYSPEEAAKIANVVSRSYVIFDLEQQLAEYQLKYGYTHQIVQQLYADVYRMISQLMREPKSNIEAIGPASVKIIAPATVPLKPIALLGNRKWLAILFAVFLAAFASISMALIFEYADPTFRSPQDVEQNVHLPYLGYIPRAGRTARDRLISDIGKEDLYTQAYQKLSDQMYLLIKGKKLKSLLLASALRREGTNWVIANLGIFLSEKFKKNTLIVDANLRRPTMQYLFHIPSGPGLAEILEGQADLEKAVSRPEENLSVLPAGQTSQDPIALLSSMKLMEVLKQAQGLYDVVLIHCAQLNDFRDGEVISLHADGVVYVISEGRSRRQIVKHVVKKWENQKSNLLGVVLNNRRFVIPEFIYKRI